MRTVNRLLALLLGLGLAGLAVLVAVEAVQLRRGEPAAVVPRGEWHRQLSTLRWDDPGIRTAGGVLVAVGAAVLALQLVPRRTIRLPLRSPAGRASWLARASLDQVLAEAARRDPEVLAAEARTRRRRVGVQVTAARSTDPVVLRERVTAALTDELAALDLERAPSLAVRARHAKDRVR